MSKIIETQKFSVVGRWRIIEQICSKNISRTFVYFLFKKVERLSKSFFGVRWEKENPLKSFPKVDRKKNTSRSCVNMINPFQKSFGICFPTGQCYKSCFGGNVDFAKIYQNFKIENVYSEARRCTKMKSSFFKQNYILKC